MLLTVSVVWRALFFPPRLLRAQERCKNNGKIRKKEAKLPNALFPHNRGAPFLYRTSGQGVEAVFLATLLLR